MLDAAAQQLNMPSGVVVIPTDTVYGIVARAKDQLAVERLYKLKDRSLSERAKPGTLIAASLEQLEELGFKHRYLKAVEEFWPGAVSVIIPLPNPELKYLHLGKMALAVRIPDNQELLELLKKTGPLMTSSANHPDQPTAINVQQAKQYFGDQVDGYFDGGDLSDHQPSTVIRIIDDAIEVLRQGAVKINQDQ